MILYIHFTYGTPFCILAVISGGRGAIHEVMVDHRRAGVVFFVVIAQIADVIVQWLGIPVPGSIVGIGMLFALLKCKIIRLEWIELGSQWLLAEMLLFFYSRLRRHHRLQKLAGGSRYRHRRHHRH